jgi:pilus assembly protein CpaB
MRARTLIVLLLAVVLAGGTAFLARAWLASQRQAAVAEAAPVALPTPSRSVLIAKAGIAPGRILKPEDMVWQPWPDGAIDKAYIVIGTRTPESFAGWVARQPIAAGEPISEAKIIAPGNRGFLAAVLRPGMRAISVPVTVTTGISGFIFPGDDVDIMITFAFTYDRQSTDDSAAGAKKDKDYEHKAAETILHAVRVIAIDQRLESKAGEAVVAHTATLEVTPKQSEMIALASEIGKLSLTLRSLVPAASEVAASESAASDSPAGVQAATVTLDSEVASLLPKPLVGEDKKGNAAVTILRGSAKTSESTSQPSASPAPSSANPAAPSATPAAPYGSQAAPPVSRGL